MLKLLDAFKISLTGSEITELSWTTVHFNLQPNQSKRTPELLVVVGEISGDYFTSSFLFEGWGR
jgi:hypothetical protein